MSLPWLPALDGADRALCEAATQSPSNDETWDRFRRHFFPGERLNLNPGTLGTPSTRVQECMARFHDNEWNAFPLGQYRRGREALREARAAALRLWHNAPFDNVPIAVTQGSTFTMNLVTLALHGTLQSHPIRVLATQHEHHGGIGGFEHHSGFAVHHLPDEALSPGGAFEEQLRAVNPAVVLISQVTYTEGRILPIEALCDAISAHAPEAFVILDLSQGTGLLPPPVELIARGAADLMVTSAHKWLNGPAGTGFLWASERARKLIAALQYAGEPLDPEAPLCRFEPAGGQDFSVFAGLWRALELRELLTEEVIAGRSAALARHFMQVLADTIDLDAAGCAFVDPAKVAGTLCLSFAGSDPYPIYVELNEGGVHTKCVKGQLAGGRELRILRLGFPFYESRERVGEAAGRVATAISRGYART